MELDDGSLDGSLEELSKLLDTSLLDSLVISKLLDTSVLGSLLDELLNELDDEVTGLQETSNVVNKTRVNTFFVFIQVISYQTLTRMHDKINQKLCFIVI